MKPTLQDIRIDTLLSNISVAYKNDVYVAEQILPVVRVSKVTGKYYIYGKEKFRKVPSLRGMGSVAKEVGYSLSQSDAFVCKDHALKQLVPDELVGQALAPLNPSLDATENITERLLIEKEYDLATYMKNVANFTNDVTLSTTPTDQWSDYANSDPIADIRLGIQTIHSEIFQPANVLVLGKEVYDKLIDHPDIVDRIKYSALGVVTTDLLARIFNVSKVIIAGAGYETAKEGQPSVMGYVWGKYAWLLYVNPRPAIRSISYGYHLQYKTRKVDKWYNKDREGTFVRVHDFFTREIVAEKCGYLIKNAVA